MPHRSETRKHLPGAVQLCCPACGNVIAAPTSYEPLADVRPQTGRVDVALIADAPVDQAPAMNVLDAWATDDHVIGPRRYTCACAAGFSRVIDADGLAALIMSALAEGKRRITL